MPLTEIQKDLAKLLAQNRSLDSYLAGGAALHFSPDSTRFSRDMDFFQNSDARVQEAFEADSALLLKHGFAVEVNRKYSSFISAKVSLNDTETEVDWALDSAYRFMPLEKDPEVGYRLHSVDLATNKVLTLAGRDEPRDYYDVLYIINTVLPLGALVWAAPNKDPGYNPLSLLEILKRKGKYRPQDFKALQFTHPVDVQEMKMKWLAALDAAEAFVESRPMKEHGCLYYSYDKKCFVQPEPGEPNIACHFGRPGGIIPQIVEN